MKILKILNLKNKGYTTHMPMKRAWISWESKAEAIPMNWRIYITKHTQLFREEAKESKNNCSCSKYKRRQRWLCSSPQMVHGGKAPIMACVEEDIIIRY